MGRNKLGQFKHRDLRFAIEDRFELVVGIDVEMVCGFMKAALGLRAAGFSAAAFLGAAALVAGAAFAFGAAAFAAAGFFAAVAI